MAGPVLIAYDGSERAARAIDTAAELLGEVDAIVLHVATVTAFGPPVPGSGIGLGPPEPTPEAPDDATVATQAEDAARAAAEEGAALAARAGLSARPLVAMSAGGGETAKEIVAAAAEHDARLIVMGSHGHGALHSALLGSVTAGVISNSERPVLVLPAAD